MALGAELKEQDQYQAVHVYLHSKPLALKHLGASFGFGLEI
jgi:hypothetical protein